ncbi:unnamed protein product, partial [Prorocentrum cordatum]
MPVNGCLYPHASAMRLAPSLPAPPPPASCLSGALDLQHQQKAGARAVMFEGSVRQVCPADALSARCQQRPAGTLAVGDAAEHHSQSEAETLPGIPEEQTCVGPSSIFGAAMPQASVRHGEAESESAPRRTPSGLEDSTSGAADDTGDSWHAGRGRRLWQTEAPQPALENSQGARHDRTAGVWQDAHYASLASQLDSTLVNPSANSENSHTASAPNSLSDGPEAGATVPGAQGGGLVSDAASPLETRTAATPQQGRGRGRGRAGRGRGVRIFRRLRPHMHLRKPRTVAVPRSLWPCGGPLPRLQCVPVEDSMEGVSYMLCAFCQSDKLYRQVEGLVQHARGGDCPRGYEEWSRLEALAGATRAPQVPTLLEAAVGTERPAGQGAPLAAGSRWGPAPCGPAAPPDPAAPPGPRAAAPARCAPPPR